jgi:CheY-like chemotaxis protein
MIASTCLVVVFVPSFYVVMQRIEERRRRRAQSRARLDKLDAEGVSLILILSDINMPGMTGLELLPKAKAMRPDVPIMTDQCSR